jgi:type VI protein secretion system component Hcp
MLKTAAILFATGLLFLCQVSMSHAENLFLLLGGIPGESKDPQHPGWINLRSATWGHGEAPPGSPSKIQFGRVQITKHQDSTSATLALLGATGQALKDFKLEITRPTADTNLVLFRMKLTNARVASYAAAAHLDPATESVSFSFDTITWITFKIDELGRQSPGSAACFDVVNNKSCGVSF